MSEIIATIEALLQAYERSTPSIDQKLADRAQWAIRFANSLAVIGLVLILAVLPAHAFDRSNNPDKFTSIGLDVSSGKLAGIQKDTAAGAPHTDGGFVKGLLDVRVPITNALSMHAFGSSTGVNNNLQFSEGTEIGVGLRVFLQ